MNRKPLLFTVDQLAEEEITIQFPGFQSKTKMVTNTSSLLLSKHPLSFSDYEFKFNYIQEQLHYGNSYLANLTCETPIQINTPLEALFDSLEARYKILFKKEWLCFSPETFIRIAENKISTYPMKGTIDASLPNAEELLLNNEKELAEHYTIVDLLRNDLNGVAHSVEVKKFRYVEKIKGLNHELLQTSSHIEGTLPGDFRNRLGELIEALLPAGSVTGAPKKKTVDMLNHIEGYERGYYTGTAFYYDGKNLDSCVLIRFIEQKEKGMVFKSGGGITIHSRVAEEYQELIQKVYVPLV